MRKTTITSAPQGVKPAEASCPRSCCSAICSLDATRVCTYIRLRPSAAEVESPNRTSLSVGGFLSARFLFVSALRRATRERRHDLSEVEPARTQTYQHVEQQISGLTEHAIVTFVGQRGHQFPGLLTDLGVYLGDTPVEQALRVALRCRAGLALADRALEFLDEWRHLE